jgi:hypothetical protein
VRLPGAISCWTFAWYTHSAPGEPYDDLARAVGETAARGFDTLRICAMPSFVSRALRTGEGVSLARFRQGVSDKLRWYDFRGGFALDPPLRLVELFSEARRAGIRIVVSNWDFQQAFKFEAEPRLYERLRRLRSLDEMFGHVEATLRDTLGLLAEHDLLDVVSAVEILNEFEGAEVGPLAELMPWTAAEQGPVVATADYQRRVREEARAPIERTIEALRAEFSGLAFTVDSTWPWSEPSPPANCDVVAVNMYITNKPIFPGYYELFTNGDLWFGEVLDSPTRPLLRPGAPPYREWRASLTDDWRDLYYPQCYLGLYVDPGRWLEFFTAEFARHEAAARAQALSLLDAAQASAAGRPWYLGEGYAVNPPTTSTWNHCRQCLDFHAWVVEEALARGACGLTPTTVASPEHPDVWAEEEWLRAVNRTIREEGRDTSEVAGFVS